MIRFICLSGHAQNGKDTSANIIQKELVCRGHSAIIVHYADLLKFICKTFFGWNGLKDEQGRSLLQKIGTDCIRKKEPDFWVNFITKVISMFPNSWDYVIIPDTRFPNELYGIENAGFNFTHVRVVREDFESTLTEEQKKHISETALDGVEPDFWLHNSTIDKLEKDIRDLCDVIESFLREVDENSTDPT